MLPCRNTLIWLALRGLIAALFVAPLAVGGEVRAQATGDYQSYRLQHARADEVQAVLGPLLPGLGTQTQLAIDVAGNCLLVSGPAEAHEITRQLLAQLDRPGQNRTALPAGAPPVLRTLDLPGSDVAAWALRLQQEFAGRTDVRIAANVAASQLVVLAPPDVHERIAASVAGPAPQARPVLAGSSRLVQLANCNTTQIDERLRQMLGARLTAANDVVPGLRGYWIVARGGSQVGIALNDQYHQVAIVGPEPANSQFVKLIQALDSPPAPVGQAIRLYPLGKADLAKVRRAVDAYRGKLPAENGQPAADDGAGKTPRQQSAVQLASWNGQEPIHRGPFRFAHMLLQQAPGDPPPAAPGEEEVDPLRDLPGDVEVEVLPELDVIILRGNQREVEEIMRIIDEIERLSALEQPQVEVVQLLHAPSAAVGKLVAPLLPNLLSARQGQVSVTALVKPNAMLLIGRGDALQVVREMLAKLDQPADPQADMRVFQLKHAAAAAVRQTIQEFFANRQGLGPVVLATADARTNSLIVHAAPRDMQEVEALIARLDVGESAAVNELRIFHLRNTLASDLAPLLQAALTGATTPGGAPAAGPNVKSTVLEFLTVDPNGQRLLRSGILSDVRITPEPRTNTLVVSAPAESLDLLGAVIEQLDALPATTAQIKVFKIVNGDAEALVRMLQLLLGSQAAAAPGPELAAALDETSLAPLRFSVDTRTNSIIATGSQGDLTIVEAILLRLDESDVENRLSTVYRLKNAPAIDVAISLNEYLRSERQVQLAAPGSFSPFRQIESEVIVVPEPVSNTLIISATPQFYDEIIEIVEDLDAQRPQVLIQVLIAEVQLNKTDEFGVELGLQDSLLFDRSLLSDLTTIEQTTTNVISGVATTNQTVVGAQNAPGFNFNNLPLGNSGSDKALSRSDKVGGQGLTSFSVGRTNNELGYGGLVLSASSESVSLLIRALKETRRLDVLSRPQIMTLDNQPSFIQVGQRVPRITGTTINQFSQVNSIELENVGLILGVTPRISPDGLVVMEIDAEKSELGPDAEGIPISISATGEVIRSPRINTTTAQTTVSAASGQTIVLGGLIVKSNSQIHRKVPLLGDIPLLGMLFRYDASIGKRNELLIILTPHVVRNEADAEALRLQEEGRMNWCLADVQQVHGDKAHDPRSNPLLLDAGGEVVYPDGTPAEGELVEEVVPGFPGSGVPAPASPTQTPPPQQMIPQQAVPPQMAPPQQVPQQQPPIEGPYLPPSGAACPPAPGSTRLLQQPVPAPNGQRYDTTQNMARQPTPATPNPVNRATYDGRP